MAKLPPSTQGWGNCDSGMLETLFRACANVLGVFEAVFVGF